MVRLGFYEIQFGMNSLFGLKTFHQNTKHSYQTDSPIWQ